jgi:hypothetical protein
MRPTISQVDVAREDMGLVPVSEAIPGEGLNESEREEPFNPSGWKRQVGRAAAYIPIVILAFALWFVGVKCGAIPDTAVRYPQIPPKLGCYIAAAILWAVLLAPTAFVGLLFRHYCSRLEKVLLWVFCFIPLVVLAIMSYQVFR